MWDFRDDKDMKALLYAKGIEPITYTEGHDVANENGAVGYYECSVLSEKMRKKCLKMIFEAAIRAVLKASMESAMAKKEKKKKCLLM